MAEKPEFIPRYCIYQERNQQRKKRKDAEKQHKQHQLRLFNFKCLRETADPFETRSRRDLNFYFVPRAVKALNPNRRCLHLTWRQFQPSRANGLVFSFGYLL